MTIRSRAVIETLKVFAAYAAGGVAFYLLISFLGPKLGIWTLLGSLIGGFTWVVYDFYVHKFTVEEKFKL